MWDALLIEVMGSGHPLQIDGIGAGGGGSGSGSGGGGIAYLPADLVRSDLQDGSLVQLLTGFGTHSMPIHAIYRRDGCCGSVLPR